mgnify:CR=1 FL=1
MAKAQLQPWEVGLGKGRDHVARLAALVGVLTPLWLALAALGTKWGWWDWRFGLQQAPLNALGLVFVVALCALYAVLVVRPWGGRLLTAVAFLAPVVPASASDEDAALARKGVAREPALPAMGGQDGGRGARRSLSRDHAGGAGRSAG